MQSHVLRGRSTAQEELQLLLNVAENRAVVLSVRLSTATINVAQLIVYGVGTPGVLHAVVVAYLHKSARW